MDKSLLGLKIKKLRSEYSLETGKKFTQFDLAEKLGISRSYLGDIESGRTLPNDEILLKISKVFDTSVSDITSNTETTNNDNNKSNNINTLKTPSEFKTPEEAMQFILRQPAIMGYGGFDVDKMINDEIVEFANELLRQIELISYKYKK